jgi:alkylation response protein AidB-like acyl-CoA dehydrogenase
MTGLIHDTDDHRAIRESVAKIADRYGPSYFLERARADGDIDELWAELGAAGLLGVHLPEEYGGGGAGLQEAVVIVEELAAHGMPMLIWVISPAMIGSVLAEHASDELKQRWLPGIADGSTRVAFGLTEPDAGSNSHQVSTTATRDGNGWRISGSKYYISAVDHCDAILVVARDAEHSTAEKNQLSIFLVPLDSPGLSYQRIETSIVSPDKQFTVFFDDVRVEPDALVGVEGNGLRQVFAALNPERILVGAITGGVGRYAVEKAVDYAKQREVWGVPIGQHQGVSHPVAAAHIDVEISRLATRHAAQLYDAGHPGAGEAANVAKYAGAEAALKALDQSIQTHGGNGLSREYGLSELWFVTRLMRTAPVSREMVLNFVAQTSLGLPRSY